MSWPPPLCRAFTKREANPSPAGHQLAPALPSALPSAGQHQPHIPCVNDIMLEVAKRKPLRNPPAGHQQHAATIPAVPCCLCHPCRACARPCTSDCPAPPAGHEQRAAPVPAIAPPGSQRGPSVAQPVAAAPEPPAEQQQQPGQRAHAAHSCGPRPSALPPAGAAS